MLDIYKTGLDRDQICRRYIFCIYIDTDQYIYTDLCIYIDTDSFSSSCLVIIFYYSLYFAIVTNENFEQSWTLHGLLKKPCSSFLVDIEILTEAT